MTLFQATLFTGIALIAFGAHFLWHGISSAPAVKAFPRSKVAAVIFFGSASAWFLYHILHLGPADFGQYRHLLFALFGLSALGAFYFVPDFLAVRGLAALLLLAAQPLLNAAYMQDPASRLWLVSFVYLAILVALVLGACPYRLRDCIDWLYREAARSRIFGACFALYGVLLIVIALRY
ncbi:MAG: Uncharacterised protein [Opitutia bacterium UBA7350]|nr:MAG: Uncharacterised protein [Opitutae bacterium UBA7350]